MRTCWLLWAATLLVAPAIPGADIIWTRIKSGSIELVTSAGEKKGRDAILPFERLQNLLGQIVNTRNITPLPVRVVLFHSRKAYEPYREGEFAPAHFISGQARDYIVMSGTDNENNSIALCEFTHALIRHGGGRLPLWLEEGLAQLYSTLWQNGTHAMTGALIPNLVAAFGRGRWIPSSRLVNVDRQAPEYTDNIRATMFRAQSWALAHLLVVREDYRLKLPRLVKALNEGQRPEEAFQSAYGLTFPQLDNVLQTYVRVERFKAGLFDVEFGKTRPESKASALTSAESEAMLADLLVGAGKYEEAARMYASLAEKQPNRPEAPQGLGYLALRKGDREAALKHFARAAALNSDNARLYRDYANLLDSAGRRDKELQTALEKALNLDPNLDQARLRLAQYFLRNEEFALAASHFRLIKVVPREQENDYIEGMFNACYRAGDRDGARSSMQRLRERASTPGEMRTVERMLNALAQPQQPQHGFSPKSTAASNQLDFGGLPLATGTLDKLDCSAASTRLIVVVEGKPTEFVIESAQGIVLRGFGAGTIELTCGPLKPEQVSIRYSVDEKAHPPTRRVRSIERLKRP